MKNLIVLLIGIGLGYLICNLLNPKPPTSNEIELSEGKYISGTVVSTATSSELGMIEFHSQEHNDSYIALFDGAYFPTNNLYQEVYAKISADDKVPFAKDITTTQPDSTNIFLGNIRTTINYHSSTNHKVEGGGFHTKMHYRTGGLTQSPTSNEFTVELYNSEGRLINNSKLQISESHATLLNSYGPGIIYAELHGNTVIQIDSCHRHGDRIIKCRNDE